MDATDQVRSDAPDRQHAREAKGRRRVYPRINGWHAQRATVPYLGQQLALVKQAGRSRVHRRGELLLVPAGAAGLPALERFYRRSARIEIAAKLDQACAVVGSTYSGLTIRNQRTRWASCSANGTMSFNWRLLLAPEPVLDYVVWHEVCHLEVLDHSRRFWSLVGRFCPDHREHVAWLRRNGHTLVL